MSTVITTTQPSATCHIAAPALRLRTVVPMFGIAGGGNPLTRFAATSTPRRLGSSPT